MVDLFEYMMMHGLTNPKFFTLVVVCVLVVVGVVLLLFVFFFILFVCKCVLPPGDNPFAVNKYIRYTMHM